MRVAPLAWGQLAAMVLASSLLGLSRPMMDEPVDGGWSLFGDVWKANLWGDLAFIAGTVGTGLLVMWVMGAGGRRGWDPMVTMGATALAGVAATWVVYALSWSLTAEALFEESGSGFWGVGWRMLYGDDLLGHHSAWSFTWAWGWPGIAGGAILWPAVARLAAHHPGPATQAAGRAGA